MLDSEKFDFLTDRLHFIDVTDDQRINIELCHVLSVFENYVYGVVLQYDRVTSALSARLEVIEPRRNQSAGLDTYYYTLTWDKLKKVFTRFTALLNRANQHEGKFPPVFWTEFRMLRKRLEQLFSEFDADARNEYEHPSLEPYSVGNIIAWGHLMIDGAGDVTAHVGAEKFATVKAEHCRRLKELRTDLIDLFLKHFSEKRSSKELVRVRDDIEQNIDSIVAELKMRREKGDTVAFDELVHRLVSAQIFLAKEGVPLAQDVCQRLYSVAFESDDKTAE